MRQLLQAIQALIEEEGRMRLLQCFTSLPRMYARHFSILRESGKIENDSQPRIEDVLSELQCNAGNPPIEDQILENLEDLLIHWDDGEA